MDIYNLWNEIKQIGYTVRKNRIDGLKMWQPIKEKLNNFDDIPDVNFSNKIYEISKKMIYLPNNDAHENATISFPIELVNTDETSHFIIQHVRIPSIFRKEREKIITKLIQIAYNIGQAKAEMDNYPKDLVYFYNKNKMKDIRTLIDKEKIKKINERLSSLTGVIKISNKKKIKKSSKVPNKKTSKKTIKKNSKKTSKKNSKKQ